MQESTIHNCYFHYFSPDNKNGTGTKNATVRCSGGLLTVYDAAGAQLYQLNIFSLIEYYISPKPGEPMLGVAQELMIFMSQNEWGAVQPSEEDEAYIQNYERELNLLFVAMSGGATGAIQTA